MNFNTVLDISSIIWDEADYDTNKYQYYNLLSGISTLLVELEKKKPKILLRNELLKEITNAFPFDKIPNDFWAIGNQIYSFLGNIGSNITTYPNQIIPDITSIPNLIKAYYNDTTQNEVYYMISKIHSDTNTNVYFTFNYLWGDSDTKLKTEVGEELREYETIISDKENELEDFFAKFKLIFEHHSKHDKKPNNTKEKWEEADNKDRFVSRLSCYNGMDNIRPQEILDKKYRMKFGDCYYSYDTENEVYVIFRFTRLNIYHGYDEYNIERIPKKVRKHFNK